MEGCLAAQRKGPAEAVLRDRPFFRKTWNQCALLVCRKKRFGSLKTAKDIASLCGLDTGDSPSQPLSASPEGRERVPDIVLRDIRQASRYAVAKARGERESEFLRPAADTLSPTR